MIDSIASSRISLARAPDSADRAVGRSPAGERTNPVNANGLSAAELRQIDALRATDRQVRAHEQAHMAVGAGLTGSPSFTYQIGPDQQRYAVGGEVSIDVSPGADPEETIARATQIRAAALAPADPSPQDHKVAALAAQMERAARQELASTGNAGDRQPIDARPAAALAAYQAVAEGPRPTGFATAA